MQAFLDHCVAYILEKHPKDFSKLCIVLPNRRAGLFLKKHIAERLQKTILLPEIYGIEDFVGRTSGLNIIDNINLIFELYEVHKAIEKERAQDFEKFADWGFSLLRDFSDIDEYLVDPEKLFSYLKDVKAVEQWNPEQKEPSDFQKRYLRFYESLLEYYKKLNERLAEQESAYMGRAYRNLAASEIETIINPAWEKVFFIGFNALTEAEKNIITKLKHAGKAEILWDSDHYYLEQEFNGHKQEAGYFQRKLFRERNFAQPKWIFEDYKSGSKNIDIIGVPLNVGQAKVCANILKEKAATEETQNKTAVVLAGESMLIPLLNSLPEEIRRFNITMGLPLVQTPLFNLIELLIKSNETLSKYREIYGKAPAFHLKDVLSIFRNPLISGNAGKLFGLSPEKYNERIIELAGSNRLFISGESLSKHFTKKTGNFPHILFAYWEDDAGKGLEAITALLQLLKEAYIANNPGNENYKHELELEYLFHFSGIIKRIIGINQKYAVIKNLRSLQSLFKQFARQAKLPFYGEPLQGLQVMGMLETRTLDFENLILLSANEGILPAGKHETTFIPYDIKTRFGLPTHKDRESVYAYHFYRLLQRSKNVHILYNTEPGEMGGGDKSRFISQILNELSSYNPDIVLREHIATNNLRPEKRDGLKIPKSDALLKVLEEKAKEGFSATAMNAFRKCSLQFYFRTVLGIEDAPEIEETLGSSTMGTIIHKVLQRLYEPFTGKVLQEKDLKSRKEHIQSLTEKYIAEEFPGGEIKQGKNLLLVNVIEKLLENHLVAQLKQIAQLSEANKKVSILDLEEKIKCSFEELPDKGPGQVYLKGFIDRVDRLGSEIHVLDYKTGSVESKETSIASVDELHTNTNTDKVFQLLFYSWLYHNSGKLENNILKAGIIPLRRSGEIKQFLSIGKREEIDQDILNAFGQYLKELLQGIFDPALPFSPTDDPQNCKFCTFSNICGK